MFEHADADDLVVSALLLNITVIHRAHFNAAAEPACFDLLHTVVVLVGGQFDAHGVNTEMFRRVQDQFAPAATDIEKPLARLEAELAADETELGCLRGVQAHVWRAEIATGIHALRIQPQAVEIVGNVVVILDVLADAGERMAPLSPAVRPGSGDAATCIAQAVSQFQDIADVAFQIEVTLDRM